MALFRKKPAFVPPAPRLPVLAFVLLEDELPTLTGLVALLEGTLGVSVELDEDDDGPGVLQIVTPEGAVFITVVNAPVPDGEAEGAASRNYFWQGGVEKVAAHRAHLLVTVLGDPRGTVARSEALTRARVLTTVVSALAGMGSAIGVYIGAHEIVHEAAPYRELGVAARAAGELPVPLLVHIMAAPQEGGGAAGYTRGLETFGHDDLEIVDSNHAPDEVYTMLANVVAYLLQGDAHLMPGQTLGYSEDVRLPITLADEARFFEGRALRVGY